MIVCYSWELYSTNSGQQKAHSTTAVTALDPLLGLQICHNWYDQSSIDTNNFGQISHK
jgi:hypothetical protein